MEYVYDKLRPGVGGVVSSRKPEPFRPRRVRHPARVEELSSELVVWYYPPGRHVNAKNNKNGFAIRQQVLDIHYLTRIAISVKGDSQ